MAMRNIYLECYKLNIRKSTIFVGFFDERSFGANPLRMTFSLYGWLCWVLGLFISVSVFAGKVFEGNKAIASRIKVIC